MKRFGVFAGLTIGWPTAVCVAWGVLKYRTEVYNLSFWYWLSGVFYAAAEVDPHVYAELAIAGLAAWVALKFADR